MEDAETKGGHNQAVKAGGMRIVQHKSASGATSKASGDKVTPEEEEEFGSPPKVDKHHQTLLVSGAVTKGDKDFPPCAVKAFHEKPLPSKSNVPSPKVQQNINQPRK